MSLCDEDFIPDRDCTPIDTVEINRLSSIEEYQNTTEQKRWIAWFKLREQISPFLPPELRKVWDNCTYKACHLMLEQLTIRHMQADSTKQVQKGIKPTFKLFDLSHNFRIFVLTKCDTG